MRPSSTTFYSVYSMSAETILGSNGRHTFAIFYAGSYAYHLCFCKLRSWALFAKSSARLSKSCFIGVCCVFRSRAPFNVLNSVVALDSVYMVAKRLVLGVFDKRKSNKAVDKDVLSFCFSGEGNHPIAMPIVRAKNLFLDSSSCAPSRGNALSERFNSPIVGHLVNVSKNTCGFPYLHKAPLLVNVYFSSIHNMRQQESEGARR